MKITKDHSMFYASKKSILFICDVSIHSLINSQTNERINTFKHNDVQHLNMVYRRCKRKDLDFRLELLKSCQSKSMSESRIHLFMKVYSKLTKRL